ncbi:SDR family oxidoreductase [Deinococcus soli (ex Cha et al. 2016)]|uniref:NAD(P)H dehydrogenase (Quinone) n=2 Tax=Deinococcus soli (ex Cha et al. 2016) TaxID=1309411 RepID=A0AAE3XAH0_9DEIO|nr:SDR family oxidoreductase [Deinococcus soli (ex Cha et al. 2016)]MDR6217358.1 NAD(P)H dehydrogenase (quinone) [Deinococcus soli (ex Cha et al. 2016)]MDR6326667.1 NAD(P)H dehydrogenase (quinone) [Deinococcus soli (ex Cha et al. 2016)]MDR6750606.1 NAD(P)H dehydrogenase (quinone) [Deinococcus soli (ex Cha et al. 2016)]
MTTTPARTIAVTGATGHLGRLTLQALLNRGVPAGNLVALVRDPAKAADLAAQGIQVRQADYRQPDTLSAALNGVNRLLLVSSNDFDDRVGQHRHVIDAARDAGVDLIAYTSLLNADRSGMILAGDHQATEALLRESGVPFTLLRNGWYTENYDLKGAVKNGAILGAAGSHALQPAPRQDYAEAAAAVLSTDGHAGQTYELAGDEAITLADLAAEVARQSGQPVAYHDLSAEEYARTLAGFGVPDGFAHVLADSDTGITRGELASESRDLSRLIGRPTTPTTQAVRDALTA